MADQEPNGGGNGADDNAQPQVSIFAQYVKDLSVENPSAAEGAHEVTLKFDISARSDNGVHFVIDLSYAGLFGIRNVPEDALPPFLLIEAPRLLFPFARQVISDAVANSGFPPLMLDPIDFTAAYMAQVEAQQQQSGQGELTDEGSGNA